jgi:hypothetical protein
MIRPILGAVLTSGVLAFAFLGCNSILDNNPGTLAISDEAGTFPTPSPSGTATDQPPMEGPDASTTPSDDAGDKPSPGCPAGQQMCFGTCVSLTDPLYGCGNPACTPCPSGHSTMGCQGRTCVVTACDKGYADCNATATDGCETDLSKAASCGACNAKCGVAAPLCSPNGPTFQCTNGCTPAAPLACGAECVDPNTSTNHCGNCTTACPVVANGTSACAAGACSFTCKVGFHACTDKCVAQTDPASCGPACTPCPVPAGGVATCVNDACGIQCTAPNHACNGKCVAPGDATACGAACTVCPVPVGGTATCSAAGVCGGTCPAGSHLCAGKCVADTDATACGAMCTVCAVPPNATAACTAGACTSTCSAGFADCDKSAINGCEINTMTDSANCGMCGKACVAPAVCTAGVCQ